MQNNQTKDNDLTDILAKINMPENEDEEIETIHLYIYKEPKKNTNVVDADTAKEKTHPFGLFIALFISSLLPIFSIAFQVFILLNPPIATITLFPIHKELSVKASISVVPSNPNSSQILSYPLKPVSLSMLDVVPSTGHGHQNAAYAHGTITLYNGSFTSLTVPQGLQLTGRSGVKVITDNPATIPPALPTTPPTFGKISVSAHAVNAGLDGNIPVSDINTNLNASLLAQNTNAFHGGADARDFRIVTKSDIDNALSSLEVQVTQSVQAHLLGEVQAGQALIPPVCSTIMSSDRRAGEEGNSVKVTLTERCRAIAYDTASLQNEGLQILMSLAQKSLGKNYSPIGGIQVSVIHSSFTDPMQGKGVLNIALYGRWFYQFSEKEKEVIKAVTARKPTVWALTEVRNFPGVLDTKISFQGFGDNYYLPRNTTYIRIAVAYRLTA